MTRTKSHFSLSETVEEYLENYILEHQLKAGDKIPSERDLSEILGISRTIVRKSLQLLVLNGRLEQRLGSGTFLCKDKLQRNLQDLLSISDVAKKCGRSIETKMLYLGLTECNKQIMMRLHLPIGHPVYKLVRLRILDQIPFSLETNYLDTAHLSNFNQYDFGNVPLYQTLEKHYGIKPAGGKETVGVTYTTDEEGQILKVPTNTAVFFSTGVCVDTSGKPFDYFKITTRAEFLSYTNSLLHP